MALTYFHRSIILTNVYPVHFPPLTQSTYICVPNQIDLLVSFSHPLLLLLPHCASFGLSPVYLPPPPPSPSPFSLLCPQELLSLHLISWVIERGNVWTREWNREEQTDEEIHCRHKAHVGWDQDSGFSNNADPDPMDDTIKTILKVSTYSISVGVWRKYTIAKLVINRLIIIHEKKIVRMSKVNRKLQAAGQDPSQMSKKTIKFVYDFIEKYQEVRYLHFVCITLSWKMFGRRLAFHRLIVKQ